MSAPVLLTGTTGFIAKHIAVRLLDAGHSVRGTLRAPARADEVRAAVGPALQDPAALERLSFVPLDLETDAGWDEAAAGCAAILHTASPFPIDLPKDGAVLERPAVQGTLRALRAAQAAGIGRVIVTSSIAAVMMGPRPPGKEVFDEEDWSDPDSPLCSVNDRSKTLAERAAWDFVRQTAPQVGLTVLNPGFVLGPPLDRHFGSSMGLIVRFLRGKDPMVPAFALPVVDVRDVAEAHLRALERPSTAGERILLGGETLRFVEMTRVLKELSPERRIPTRQAPDLVVRLLALFDGEIRSALPMLGRFERVSNAKARRLLDLELRPPREAVRAAGEWLLANGAV